MPLAQALHSGKNDVGVVKLLLEHGARLDLVSENGVRFLFYFMLFYILYIFCFILFF